MYDGVVCREIRAEIHARQRDKSDMPLTNNATGGWKNEDFSPMRWFIEAPNNYLKSTLVTQTVSWFDTADLNSFSMSYAEKAEEASVAKQIE